MDIDIKKIMEQAQDLQKNLQQNQQKLRETQVTGTAGGALVKVTINGAFEAQNVQLAPSLFDEEPSIIGELITAAFNDASHQIKQLNRDNLAGSAPGAAIADLLKS